MDGRCTVGLLVESRACPRLCTSLLWVHILALNHSESTASRFNHAAKETSIKFLILISFSSPFLFSCSFLLYILFLLDYLLTAFHNIDKNLVGDKVALTSSAIFLTNKIMRLSNYYFGVYSLAYITTNHGN